MMCEMTNKHKKPLEDSSRTDIFSMMLDAMSVSELTDALSHAVETATENDCDFELIDAYLGALNRKAPMPKMPDADESYKSLKIKGQIMDAIIFDLDGTLWNPADGILISWNECFASHGLQPFITKDHVEHWMGRLLPDIAAYILPHMPEDERMKLAMDCVHSENEYLAKHGGILYPGVPEVLNQLAAEYPLAIVSNCEEGYIEGFFTAHGLGNLFVDYEHPGRTGLDKAENIKLIIKRNGWKKPVYIGDTQIDYDAAHSVGIPFVHANYGFGLVNGAFQMNSFTELPDILHFISDNAQR